MEYPDECLSLGVSVSGAYVRTGQSPTPFPPDLAISEAINPELG
jgi:hypothetical protein